MNRSDHLFSDYELRAVLESHESKMLNEIDGIDGNRLLNTSVEDLCDYFEQKYHVSVPKLKEDHVTIDQSETQVDVSQDPLRAILDRSKPFYIKGTAVSFHIPYESERELFKCSPFTVSLRDIQAKIEEDEISLTYTLY